ncbi:MAG: hypothetical protein AM325_011465 [Candidatus Thorarchaeota archaeon SMTZ1-45]|nr:MAG: hypothetical protein AM325_13155 [Candidatus Thorarchaeota archaeon SMTZ1-45]
MDFDIKAQQEFIREALRIIKEANKQGIILRLMGAIAIQLHSPEYAYLHEKLGRFITDIDFVAYEKQTSKIEKFFESQNYSRRMISFSFALGGRMIFINNSDGRHIDVFLDRLEMCHKIDYKKRLEIDNPTVPLAELLLQKMQIVKISEKDIIDTTMLLLAHELGDTDDNIINAKHISRILASEWGFYYTVTTNLKKVNSIMRKFEVICEKDNDIVSGRIEELIKRIDDEPKSTSWKMRAKVGTSKKWYKDVDTPGS